MIYKDRDSLITKEGLIFRVYGYTHPRRSAVCDLEYAPESIYQTPDPRAIRFLYRGPDRNRAGSRFYKFYFDGGLKFVQERFPEYQIDFQPLRRKLVGLKENHIKEMRTPQQKLEALLVQKEKDPLVTTAKFVIDLVTDHSRLTSKDFGCFGSLLHDFYHINYSDIDLTCHGKKELDELRRTLFDLYKRDDFPLRNEFDFWTTEISESKHWRFKNYSIKEYPHYELRKAIYAVVETPHLDRKVKIEFEPIKKDAEIHDEYDDLQGIENLGWIEATAEILDDTEGFYLQSIYPIRILNIEQGPKVEIDRICNFLEEFRGIVQVGEEVLVKGYLEKVTTKSNTFYQITLSYGNPRYHEQVLKLKDPEVIMHSI